MGANFSSNQLSAAATNTVPTASYAYSSGNTKLFGVNATYTFNDQGFPGFTNTPIGQVTPYLINLASPTLTCSPFFASNPRQSVKCPVTGASLASGQYTLSFSQYTTTTYVDQNGFTHFEKSSGTVPNTLANYGGAVTFSMVPPQQAAAGATTTITPTLTVSTTITSGVFTILPTSTVQVPSTVQTITVYATTIISTSTTFGASLITITASCPTSTTTSKASTTLLKCNADNCLRAFINRSASASAFCSQYTKGQVFATPTYASQCAGLTSRVSFACTCLVQPTRAVKQRGAVENPYSPPDFTYSANVPVVTITVTAGPVATDVSGPVPSSTLTDPDATASSGTLTLTSNLPSTVTTIVVDSRTASTITVQPTTCGAVVTP
ncbi:hypothetical protein BKA65DRAFT_70636 [Rhexocercosporidium sp. MPI-PUGE-AT-0058]|nr:hypothetical protein BKA65DRAFT_70636 [Rhexocercosporidium sp. MPI-PUGE-AT-0058]